MTAPQILEAARQLFAENGFTNTTMRQITSKAEVNLAAVNYHFGSKQGLIQAVAENFLTPLCDSLNQRLIARINASEDTVTVEELIEMMMRALLEADANHRSALSMFMRLLDLLYQPNQSEMRDHLKSRYAEQLASYLQRLRQDSAHMSDDEFFWRIHFMLGSIVFTLSNYRTLNELENVQREVELERILHRMVPVLTAGMLAQPEHNAFCAL